MKNSIALFLILALVSCSEPKQSKIPVIDFENDLQKGVAVPLSAVASSVEYIPLESAEGALLGGNHIVQATDLYYFIADNQNDEFCKVFDKSGRFIRNIGQRGRGPNELNNLTGMQADNDIVILYSKQKMITFNHEGEIISNVAFKDLIGDSGDKVLLLGKNKFSVNWFDTKTSANKVAIFENNMPVFEFTYPQYRKAEIRTITVGNRIMVSQYGKGVVGQSQNNGQLRGFSKETDTVYSISYSKQYEVNPSFILSFGKYKFLLDDSNEDTSIKLTSQFFQESDHHLFLRVIFPENGFTYRGVNRVGYALYDKENQKLMGIPYSEKYNFVGLVNDIDDGAPFWPTTSSEDAIYQTIEAVKFIEWSEISGSEKMKQIASTLTYDSNPVLVVAKLR